MKNLINELRKFATSKSLSITEVGSYRLDPEGEHYSQEEYDKIAALSSTIEVQASIPSLGIYPVLLYVISELEAA